MKQKAFYTILLGLTIAILTGIADSEKTIYTSYVPSLQDTTVELSFQIYNNETPTEPVLRETRRVEVRDSRIDLDFEPGLLLPGEDYFIDILSGDEIIASREPLMRPEEPMAVGLEVGMSGEDLYIAADAVGIGTTTPAVKLDVEGGITSYQSGGSFIYLNPGASGSTINYSGSLDINETSGYPGGLGTANRLLIDGFGNVGIGSSSPAYKLDVDGTARVTGFIMPTGAGSNRVLTSNATGTATWQDLPSMPSDNVTGSGTATRVAFWNGANTVTSNANLYWDNTNSRLGIGTASPEGRLAVRQDMTDISTSFTYPHLKLMASNTVDNTGFVGITFAGSTSENYGWSTGALRSTGGQSDFVWKHHSSSALGTEYMRILSTGNVGIGTSSPSAKLEVTGDALINGVTAGRGNSSISSNTAFGNNALSSITSTPTSGGNTAIGSGAMANRISGQWNTAVGGNTLQNDDGSANNVALGYYSMQSHTSGGNNLALGAHAMRYGATGEYNVAVGGASLEYVDGGYQNVALGTVSGQSITTGWGNIFIGHNAGSNILQKEDAVNSMALGRYSYTTADHQFVYGGTAVNEHIFTAGRVVINDDLDLSQTNRILDSDGDAPSASGQVLAYDGSNYNWQLPPGSGLSGSGTNNYISRWTPDGTTLGNSSIWNDGTYVRVIQSSASPVGARFYVQGAPVTTSGSEFLAHIRLAGGSNHYGVLRVEDGGAANALGPVLEVQKYGTGPAAVFTGGNVGIGTTAPAHPLHVHGPNTATVLKVSHDIHSGTPAISVGQTSSDKFTVSSTGQITVASGHSGGNHISVRDGTTMLVQDAQLLFADGSTAAPAYSFISDLNTGIYRPASDQLAFSTAGSERVRVNASGSVGIGTTAPLVMLDVRGNSAFGTGIVPTSTETENIINILSGSSSDGASNGIAFMENTSGFGMKLGYDGTGAGAANKLAIYSDTDTEIITFQNGGNIGLGVATPAAQLHTSGTVRFEGIGGSGAHLTIDGSGNITRTTISGGISGSGSDNYLARWNGSGALQNSAVYVTDGGDVGIGTTSPNYQLHVEENSTGSTDITVSNTNSSGDMGFRFSQATGLQYAGLVLHGHQEMSLYNNNTGGYFTFSNSAGSERMRITSAGYVGIGTTAPSTQLHTTGGVRFAGIGGSGAHLTIDGSGNITRTTISASGVSGSGTSNYLPKWSGGTSLDNSAIYQDGTNLAIGLTDSESHGLNVSHYSSGYAAVRGMDRSGSSIYAEGRLGQLGSTGLPLSVTNIGVLGIKPALGGNGVAVYAWNNDNNTTNYAVYANANGSSGTKYGIYSTASGTGTNYAGYFEGDVMTTGSHYLTNTNTRILQGAGNSVRMQTNSGYIDVGPQNTSYAHIYTDRPSFYFNKELYVLGNRVWHDGYHPGGGVSGSGTTNYLPKWTGASSLGNSRIMDNGTVIRMGDLSGLTNSAAQVMIALNTDGSVQNPTNDSHLALHLHHDADANGQGVALGFGVSTSDPSIGAKIAHIRVGSMSYGDLAFYTKPSSGGSYDGTIERMRITADGNVGIGTTAPLSPLDVRSSGGIRVTNPSSTANYMQMETPGTWHRIYTTNNLTIQSGGSITLTPASNLTFSGISGTGNHLYIDASGNITRTTISGGGVSGSGTSGRAARWTGTTSLGTSAIYDNGSNIAVGTSISSSYRIYAYQGAGSATIYGYNSYGGTTGMAGIAGATSASGTGYLGYYDGTNHAAVYGNNTTAGKFAGYFNGDVHITGNLTVDGTSPGGGSSVWTTSGSDIYYNSGKVGIGTTIMNGKLHVDASTTSSGTQYGIYQYLDNQYAGYASNYGLYNYVRNHTGNSNSGYIYGIYNYVYKYGTGTGYGIYNNTYNYGTSGTYYGDYTYSYRSGDYGSNYGTRSYAYNGTYVYGVYAYGSSGSSATYGLYAVGGIYPTASARPSEPENLNSFGIYSSGDFAASGTKSAIIRTNEGPKALYCQESPENWFEDFGSGAISGGKAQIPVSPDYLSSVTIDEDNPMKVFITPNARLGEWWVEKGQDSFTLHAPEASNGAEFDFRIVAKRKDFEELRMPVITSAWTDHFLYPNIEDVPEEHHEVWIGSAPIEDWLPEWRQYMSPQQILEYDQHLKEHESN